MHLFDCIEGNSVRRLKTIDDILSDLRPGKADCDVKKKKCMGSFLTTQRKIHSWTINENGTNLITRNKS